MRLAVDVEQLIAERVQESLAIKQALLGNAETLALIGEVGSCMTQSLRNGGTVFFYGNGGSAADAQHLAAELVGRFGCERPALRGCALTTNTSSLTAIGNDYGYESVFSRQLEAMGSPGDIAIGISTSGASKNVLNAIAVAKQKGLITVAMTGVEGGPLRRIVDHCICVESDRTPRIQELHIMIGHILCEIVEEQLFGALTNSQASCESLA
ncbi:MAG TPA: D-sedoheptulose 7-phosphate isomerase [Terriglobales bacterium]|nr:D-sedoheptulose 7-phosphate isomerase [Terriglobales bacterium]